MYYEDRDHILVRIVDLLERKLRDKHNFTNEQIDELFDDATYDKMDELFEPFADGWRNYN